MALPKWDKLTEEQKQIFSKFFDQKKWDDLNDGEKGRFVDSALLGDVNTVPRIGVGLPLYRKWALPDPQKESLYEKRRPREK